MYRCCILWWLCINVYMYVVSVDVPLWQFDCCNMCTLRGSVTSGGIGGMVGYRYCMWVEYRVVWYVSVCLMSSSSFLLRTLLPLYVYIRTSTDVPLSELPQRLADTILHSRMSFSCGKACPLVAVEARLMVHPRTFVCRRIEEVVYLEGKRKRT